VKYCHIVSGLFLLFCMQVGHTFLNKDELKRIEACVLKYGNKKDPELIRQCYMHEKSAALFLEAMARVNIVMMAMIDADLKESFEALNKKDIIHDSLKRFQKEQEKAFTRDVQDECCQEPCTCLCETNVNIHVDIDCHDDCKHQSKEEKSADEDDREDECAEEKSDDADDEEDDSKDRDEKSKDDKPKIKDK